MSDITTVTLNQLNALTRGGEVSAASNNTDRSVAQTLGNTATKVVVSQVAANIITLTNPQTKQSVQLPANVLSNLGNVKAGQSFELLNLPNKPNTFALVPSSANALSSKTSQVLASTNISVNDNQLSSLVTKASAQGDINYAGKPIVTISGKVTGISANQITVSFKVPNSNLPPQQAQITLTNQTVSKLSVNANINLAVDVSGKQAKILTLSTSANSSVNSQSSKTANLSANFGSQLAQLNIAALPNKLISASILQQLSTNQASSSQTAISSQALNRAVIPLTDAKLTDLPKTLLSSLQNAIAKVNTSGASQVALRIESAGNPNTLKLSVLGSLVGTSAGPSSGSLSGGAAQASAELNIGQVRTLLNKGSTGNNPNAAAPSQSTLAGNAAVGASTRIAGQGFIANRGQLISKQVGVSPAGLSQQLAGVNQNQAPAQTSQATSNSNTAVPNQNIAAPAPLAFKTDLLLQQLTKFLAANSNAGALPTPPSNSASNSGVLSQLIAQLPNSKLSSAIEQIANLGAAEKTQSPVNIAALKSQVQALSKLVQNQTASQTQTLSNIINALNADADIDSLSPETQTLLRNIREQIPVANNTQATIDPRLIQQLVGAPPNTSPISALSPTAASGFISGLVALLQVSLASKLQQQSNKQASKMQDQLPEVLKSLVPNVTNAQSARLMQDFRQFDAKHTLSAEVAKMLFSHQHHKLKGIESALQGQDQLYYALPNMFNKNADDIELLVKRETRENNKEESSEKNTSWYLTMKLDVGPLGQMLAKTQIKDDEIKLQLYTSTPALKNKAMDMLPYLQKRLLSLGINLVEKSCQLGKIPKQLKTEHYQVFETQV